MADSPVSINTPGASNDAPAGPSPQEQKQMEQAYAQMKRKMAMEEICLLYTSPSPRDVEESRMPSSA